MIPLDSWDMWLDKVYFIKSFVTHRYSDGFVFRESGYECVMADSCQVAVGRGGKRHTAFEAALNAFEGKKEMGIAPDVKLESSVEGSSIWKKWKNIHA